MLYKNHLKTSQITHFRPLAPSSLSFPSLPSVPSSIPAMSSRPPSFPSRPPASVPTSYPTSAPLDPPPSCVCRGFPATSNPILLLSRMLRHCRNKKTISNTIGNQSYPKNLQKNYFFCVTFSVFLHLTYIKIEDNNRFSDP